MGSILNRKINPNITTQNHPKNSRVNGVKQGRINGLKQSKGMVSRANFKYIRIIDVFGY